MKSRLSSRALSSAGLLATPSTITVLAPTAGAEPVAATAGDAAMARARAAPPASAPALRRVLLMCAPWGREVRYTRVAGRRDVPDTWIATARDDRTSRTTSRSSGHDRCAVHRGSLPLGVSN